MQLASKESDIEQLREKLNDMQQRIENSSITSLQTDETDSNIAGTVVSGRTELPFKTPDYVETESCFFIARFFMLILH